MTAMGRKLPSGAIDIPLSYRSALVLDASSMAEAPENRGCEHPIALKTARHCEHSEHSHA